MYQFSLNLNSLQQKFSLTSNYLGTNSVVVKRVDCSCSLKKSKKKDIYIYIFFFLLFLFGKNRHGIEKKGGYIRSGMGPKLGTQRRAENPLKIFLATCRF